MTSDPLDGVLVIALEHAVAAPFATRQLADLGARVIKIERLDTGDFAREYDRSVHGQSSYFVWLNRGKESIQLDLKDPNGLRALSSLLEHADVFVHNLVPGAMERMDLGTDAMRNRYPNLIDCVVSGYGGGSTWSHRKAYDLLVQCETGLVSLTGTPDEVARAGISIADIAGGMYAYTGILSALLGRAKSGRGTTVEVSLFDALAEWMSQPAYYTRYGGFSPPRIGLKHATIAPYGAFGTADGSTVMLAIQSEREWQVFCRDVLLDPKLADDARFDHIAARVTNRAQLDEIIGRRVASMDRATVTRMLDASGIANAQVNTVQDFLQHPVLAERQRWGPVAIPGGTMEALRPPAILGGELATLYDVPALGQHTDAIAAEYGLDLSPAGSCKAAR